MTVREHGDRIGADLVRDVAVRRGPVGADDDAVDRARLHEMPDHVVGEERRRDVVLLQLPRRQPRPLEKRPRLAAEDVDPLVGFDRGADHAERRAVAGGGERARVAVGEDGRPVFYQPRTVRAERPIRRDVLLVDGARLALEHEAQRLDVAGLVLRVDASHALDRPEEIDGRRARRGERPADTVELAPQLLASERAHAERDAHRGGDADRGRAADHHLLDGARHLTIRRVHAVDLARGQQTLVDHHDASVVPLDGAHARSMGLRHGATVLRGN